MTHENTDAGFLIHVTYKWYIFIQTVENNKYTDIVPMIVLIDNNTFEFFDQN